TPVSAQAPPPSKIRVAVMDFRDETNHPQWAVGRGMRVEFETRLVQTGQFEVIERDRLEQIMQEQGFGATGLVDPSSAAQIGKLLGVQAMIMGSVTKFDIQTSRISVPILGSVASSEAVVAISIRVVDTNTGSIKLAEMAEGKESQANISLTLEGMPPMAFGSSNFQNTILGKATSKAVDQLIGKVMQLFPVEGYVVKVVGDKVYTNLGRAQGVRVGQKLLVYRLGEVIIDPFTNQVLSAEKTEIAVVTVTSVEQLLSIGNTDTPGAGAKIQVGDKVTIKY
ncbi:MAG: CsgG/HfaB family protein, partial [Bacillota bacterium]